MSGAEPGAFERHLRDAIALNRERAPRYAALSAGASRPLSRALIAAERLLLPVARHLDRRCAPWHRAGLPLLEELFEPMERAPALPPGPPLPCPEPRARPAAARIGRDLSAALRAEGFSGAERALRKELAALDAEPCYHCMLRHLLESALRVVCLAPGQAARASGLGLPDPTPVSRRLLRLHLWGLRAAAHLDRRAAPLQARGIPILCADVPPIPRDLPHGESRAG